MEDFVPSDVEEHPQLPAFKSVTCVVETPSTLTDKQYFTKVLRAWQDADNQTNQPFSNFGTYAKYLKSLLRLLTLFFTKPRKRKCYLLGGRRNE